MALLYPLRLFGMLVKNTKTKWEKLLLTPNGIIKLISVHSSKIEPLTSSGNAAPHLQETTLVGNHHATHPFGATMSASVVTAGTMPSALPGPMISYSSAARPRRPSRPRRHE